MRPNTHVVLVNVIYSVVIAKVDVVKAMEEATKKWAKFGVKSTVYWRKADMNWKDDLNEQTVILYVEAYQV